MRPNGVHITYLLPAYGGTGGSNSVVYDVIEFREMGVDARILAPDYVSESLKASYGHLPNFETVFSFYDSVSDQDLSDRLLESTHLVATIWSSMAIIESFVGDRSDIKKFYFVQDYEPLFYEPGTQDYASAEKTYDNYNYTLYAKSDRIVDLVRQHHKREVRRVEPSIRTDLFYPDFSDAGDGQDQGRLRTIGAMLRPRTPFRNAAGACRVLETVQQETGCSVVTFGCSREDAGENGLVIPESFTHCGQVAPFSVPDVLRSTGLFLDLSIHQGFGRLGLEAAACGNVCVLPVASGLHDILIDGEDCLYLSHDDEDKVARKLIELYRQPELLAEMRLSAAFKASRLSSRSAALSALRVLLGPQHKETPPPPPPARRSRSRSKEGVAAR